MAMIFSTSPESFHMERNGTMTTVRWLQLEMHDGLLELSVKENFEDDFQLVLGLDPEKLYQLMKVWMIQYEAQRDTR